MKIDLQVHTFLERYSLEDVINAMKRNNVDIASLMKYNEDYYQEILTASKKLPYNYRVEEDGLLIKIENVLTRDKRFFIRGVEVKTNDRFHLVVIGYKGIPRNRTTKETIEDALEADAFVYIDHPYVDCDSLEKDITKEQEECLDSLCHFYSGKIALEWSAYCKPGLRKFLCGIDVNEKAILLSQKLEKKGISIPVVADTDLHGRYIFLLDAMGTAHIETDVDVSSGSKFVKSLRENVFNRRYRNCYNNKYGYVSIFHFTFALGFPYIFNLDRNRG